MDEDSLKNKLAAFFGGDTETANSEKEFDLFRNRQYIGRNQRYLSGKVGALAKLPIAIGYELAKKAAMSDNEALALTGRGLLRTGGSALYAPFYYNRMPRLKDIKAPWEEGSLAWEVDKTTREANPESISAIIRGIFDEEGANINMTPKAYKRK